MQQFNATGIAQKLMLAKLPTAGHIIDATAGNGKDTLFLARHANAQASITAFDIQPEALATTACLLAKHGLANKVDLILDTHANLAAHIAQPIDLAVFNLGYLPGGSHAVATSAASTLTAVEQTVCLTNVGGCIVIVAYRGHPAGWAEYQLLQQYISQLPTNIYTASCWQMINHAVTAPVVYLIEKVRS